MGSAATLLQAPRDLGVESLVRRRWRTQEEEDPAAAGLEPEITVTPNVVTWGLRFQRTYPFAVSCLSSAAVHLVLLVATAWITGPAMSEPSEPVMVTAAMLTTPALEEVVTLDLPVELAEDSAVPQPLLEDVAVVASDPGVASGGAPQIELAVFASTVPVGDPTKTPGEATREGNGVASSGNGSGADGGGTAEETGTEFFGVQARGKSFVFVCDCSRSMTGQKWLELNRELARCIGELGPDKSFYIIFFDGEMHPMFAPSFREETLLQATEANVEKARLWLSGVSLGPNTEPFESMKFGASLEPDAMFFLTDGEFSDYTAPYLRDFNKQRKSAGKKLVAVHTIGFFSQKGRQVLERIAKDSGGTYKFIAEPHVPKPKRRSWNVFAPAPSAPRFGPAMPVMPARPVRPANDG